MGELPIENPMIRVDVSRLRRLVCERAGEPAGCAIGYLLAVVCVALVAKPRRA